MISLPLPIRLFLCTLAAVVLPCLPARALTVETLKAFSQGPAAPSDGLVLGPNGSFYGTTEKGGPLGGGVFYKISPTGEFAILHHFTSATGTRPSGGLMLASDGNFYGVTEWGGTNDDGTIFRMTPQGVPTVIRHLDGPTSGSTLTGPMVQDANGTLHGNLFGGSHHGSGSAFSIKTDGTGFAYIPFHSGVGIHPEGSPVVKSDGVYGVTSAGGNFGYGTVFKKPSSGSNLEVLKYMTDTIRAPSALLLAGDGNFYGIAHDPAILSNETNDAVIFKLTPAGVLTRMNTLTYVNGNSNLPVSLQMGTDGNLYGYVHGSSTYFRFTLSGTRTIVGTFPTGVQGRPLHMADGSIYGTARSGSIGNNGCIFKLLADGSSETLVTFDNAEGTSPRNLMELPGGNFLGRIDSPGSTGSTSFKLTAEAKYSAFSFLPSGSLFIGPEQSLYGMGNGKFYRADLTKGTLPLQVPWATGFGSSSDLCLASDGNFYGTSGRNIIKITPGGVQTLLSTLSDQGTGWGADDPLVEGADGLLYGVSYWGGTSATSGSAGVGNVFRTTKEGLVTILKHFENTAGAPRLPRGKLVRHPDGNIYGTTFGGTLGNGTIYKIAPNGTYTQVAEFPSNFKLSSRGLALGTDNALYGLAEGSGANPSVAFRVTTAGVFSQVASLASVNVTGLDGELMVGADGNLYSVATGGGKLPDGTIAGGGAVFRVRFGPASKTTSVTNIGNETATFQGTVDPSGLLTTASFQWATKPDFSDMQTFPAGSATAAGGIKSFTLDATGLPRSTKLYMRMAASNSENTITQVGDPIQFTTFPLPAEIVIENAAGGALEENAITDIGGTTGLRPATYAFTVRNNGQVDLTNTTITITGGAPEFSVASQPASVIPSGGTSTFTISMLPASNGTKAGTFRVESSDRYRNPISFGVTGTGFTLSTVNFATATTVPATVTSLNATGLQLGPVTLGFTPTTTTIVTLISNTGTAPVQGHFDSLPEGGLFEVSQGSTKYPFKISYVGGDGNDVVLIRARPPTASFSGPGFLDGQVYGNFSLSEYGKPAIGRTLEYGLSSDYGSTAEVTIYDSSSCYVKFPGSQGTRYYYRLTVTTTDGTVVREGNFITSPTITNIDFPTPDHVPVTTNRFHASGESLNGTFHLGFNPSPNQTLMLVKQTGTEPVSGTYYQKPQGTLLAYDFQGSAIYFILRYDGGDGNDIVLVRTYQKENARYATARPGESFFYSYRIYNSEFTMTGVPSWLAPSRSSDYINFYGTPTAKGTHRIVLTLTGSSTPIVIIVNVVEPVTQWKGRHFTPQEIADPNISGDLADASGNGVSNLMKFALGIPAKSNATANLPKQSLERAWNDDYLTLTYTRDPHAEGITYNVEVSDGLGSWQSGAGYVTEASRTPNPDGTETVVVWDVKPTKSSKSRFMRLKVAN